MSLHITHAISADDIETARMLFREYADLLGISLDFQHFEDELAGLPGKYAAPRGAILLAYQNGAPAGCTAIRPLEEGVCELKRLFVRPGFTGQGIGEALLREALLHARETGYRVMKLDSLGRLTAATRLYDRFGFRPTPPYNPNDEPDVYYREIDLAGFA